MGESTITTGSKRSEASYPFDVGAHTRSVTTASLHAQRWFDRGLNWSFGFNQEEGVACFRRALTYDAQCAMAHWGIAYATGPFYNLVWRDLGPVEAERITRVAFDHTRLARSLASQGSNVEQALAEALACRFQRPHPVPPADFDRWDDEYAAALRVVHLRFPDDQDVMALFAEALITRTPRRLWDVRTGRPAHGSDVLEALAICDRSLALSTHAGQQPHPAIAHMQIHALEMSDHPERALTSADALTELCPDIGHMVHMPGHIYVLVGDYDRARVVSEAAIAADDTFTRHKGALDFYVTARCHAIHLMVLSCMLLGRFQPALAAADRLPSIATPDVVGRTDRPKLAVTTEAYVGMRLHVLVRFGRWTDILAEPAPSDPDLYPMTTATHFYARGVAAAALKNDGDARAACRDFEASLERIPAGRRVFNNPALDILAVAREMLFGEAAYHRGDHAEAFTRLREAVRLDDALAYHEPWAWMHPPRHALAALLLEQAHVAEAEQVYRDDLGLSGRVQRCTQHPDNVWSLRGLVECLERRGGDTRELPMLRDKLAAAQALTDVPIHSSCMCRSERPRCCGVEVSA